MPSISGTCSVEHHALDLQKFKRRTGSLIFSLIGWKAQPQVGFGLIQPFRVLQDIGPELVAQTNALPFLALQIPHVGSKKRVLGKCSFAVGRWLQKHIKVISAILSKKPLPSPPTIPSPNPFPPFLRFNLARSQQDSMGMCCATQHRLNEAAQLRTTLATSGTQGIT